jgi:hypothetical protein
MSKHGSRPKFQEKKKRLQLPLAESGRAGAAIGHRATWSLGRSGLESYFSG